MKKPRDKIFVCIDALARCWNCVVVQGWCKFNTAQRRTFFREGSTWSTQSVSIVNEKKSKKADHANSEEFNHKPKYKSKVTWLFFFFNYSRVMIFPTKSCTVIFKKKIHFTLLVSWWPINRWKSSNFQAVCVCGAKILTKKIRS